MKFKIFYESVENRIFYHVTTDLQKLLKGQRGIPNYPDTSYMSSAYKTGKSFFMYVFPEDVHAVNDMYKKKNKNTSIVTVKIPDNVPIHEDTDSIGYAFYTDYFDPAWIQSYTNF